MEVETFKKLLNVHYEDCRKLLESFQKAGDDSTLQPPPDRAFCSAQEPRGDAVVSSALDAADIQPEDLAAMIAAEDSAPSPALVFAADAARMALSKVQRTFSNTISEDFSNCLIKDLDGDTTVDVLDTKMMMSTEAPRMQGELGWPWLP